jgi:hypothetical protein
LKDEIHVLESQKVVLSNKIGVLKEEMEEIHKEIFPFNVGELFYFVTSDGKIESDIWYADDADIHKYFHCFAAKKKEDTLRMQEKAEQCKIQKHLEEE